jgi:hypothetical protein
MDNWTFMEQNLHTATSSSGALDAQAKIYSESWEAAADRVTAAAEKLYKSLINDEFFIDVLNSIENLLDLVDDFISSLGGLKGSLTAIGAIVTKVFSNQIAQGLSNAAYNIRMMTASGRKAEAEARQSFIDKAIEDIPQNAEYTSGVEEK